MAPTLFGGVSHDAAQKPTPRDAHFTDVLPPRLCKTMLSYLKIHRRRSAERLAVSFSVV
jgi:hypothetical protein